MIWIVSFEPKRQKFTKTIKKYIIKYKEVKTQKYSIKMGSKSQKLT